MGWTGMKAEHYKKNGTIDRKAECDSIINYEDDICKQEVLKSAMRGSTYYAAVKSINKATYEATGKFEVFAAVILTKTDMKDYFNFLYKSMSEDCGPREDNCPASILDLLPETDNEYASDWRKRCREKLERPSIGKLPIGAIIEIEIQGEKKRLTKMAPAYQFKTPWWYHIESDTYTSKRTINEVSYTVISA